MTAVESRVREFFEVFAGASGDLTLDLLGSCFADPFLSADPSGTRAVPKDVFLQALPRRAKVFADAGVGPAALTSLDAERLDEHYLMARTGWDAPRLAGGNPVHLESSFLLHDDGDRLRIVLYLNHQGL
ncbi:hypothetical protein ACIA5D_16630 [Actinoplanes sp. NPDC051513]|uniref:hypothetical protein n=1 Tax=Actinoplanes sp. NPDC051513 TaxID=3363908 RepID=UPI00379EAF1E